MHPSCTLSEHNRCIIKKDKKIIKTIDNTNKSNKPHKKTKKKKNIHYEWDKKNYKELDKRSKQLVEDIDQLYNTKKDKKWRGLIYNKQEELLELKKYIDNNKSFRPDFNLEYPYYENPHFNYLINRKKEFVDYKILRDENKDLSNKSMIECNKDFFKLTPNQIFLKNYMSPSTPYKSLLMYHSMGVGKTCAAITIAEQFKDIIKKQQHATSSFKKKIFVLTPGALTSNFYNGLFNINKFDKDKYIESYKSLYMMKHKRSMKNIKATNYIIPQCTGNTYIDGLINIDELASLSNASINAKIKKNIKKSYSIQGHIQFCNYINNIVEPAIKDIEDNDELLYIRNKKYDEIFSNSMIIVDEAHKIAEMQLDEKSKKGKKFGLAGGLGELLLDITKYSKNLRLILLTATPMVDNPKEIIMLLNLLLQNDKKPLLDESQLFKNDNDNFILTKNGEKILRKVMRGYISYMRSETPGIFPFRIDPEEKIDLGKLPKKWCNKENQLELISEDNKLKYVKHLVCSYFGEEQYKIYTDKIESKNNHHNYSTELAQISNIVFPNDLLNKCYGEDGLKGAFQKKKNKYSYKTAFKKNKFLKYENISNYSCKFKIIFDKIKNSKGIIFIYSQFISGGVIPLALFLEQNGIKRYTLGNDSQLLDNNDIDCEPLHYHCKKTKSECKSDEFVQARYVLLTGEQLKKNPAEEAEFLKKINSTENNDGKIIKIILGSKVTGEGWDFKCIREVHILEPWHNLNQTQQTIGRAIRRCSHQSLDLKYRNVSVYLHTALNPKKSEFANIESIDLRMYRLGELKDIKIAKIRQMLKEEAVDCMLNKVNNLYLKKDWSNLKIDIETSQGNTIKNFNIFDKDFSFICDYSICDYKCFDKENQTLIEKSIDKDEDTFQFFHSTDKINTIIEAIKEFYKTDIKYSNYQNIKKYINSKNILVDTDKRDSPELIKALDEIVKKKILIERHDGNIGYIIYLGNYYIFNINDQFLPIAYRNEDYSKKKSSINLENFLTQNAKNPEIKITKSKTVVQILNDMPSKGSDKDITYLIKCMKFIDRLDNDSYRNLLEYSISDKKFKKTDRGKLFKKVFEEHLLEKDTKYYLIDNTQKQPLKQYYIYDKFTKQFQHYHTEDAKFTEYDIPSQKIIGFLDKLKSGFAFKIADMVIDRVRGAVCIQNSKPGAICDFIKRVDPNTYKKLPHCSGEELKDSKSKLGKVKLCDILEDILREKELTKKSISKKKYFFRYYLDIIPPINK